MNRFIWGTHILPALLISAWSSSSLITTWGVAGPWWDSSLVPTAAKLLVAWMLLFGFPSGWLEAWLLATGHRLVARIIVLTYVGPTWYVTHFLAALAGEYIPVERSSLVFAWTTFALLVGGQAAAAAWMRRWSFPSVHRGRGQRLARSLGLIE